jgi:Uma2 family endonuclease
VSTAPVLEIGPEDHGRPLALEAFEHSRSREGYHYELIDGKLYVSPKPNLPAGRLENWLLMKVYAYSAAHPEVVNYVTNNARVFVPEGVRTGVTAPEPDLAGYEDFPLEAAFDELAWQDVSPILVAEVLSDEDPDKDLVRNVELYLQVPSIREYWVLDSREDPNRPTLLVYRRRGQRWPRVIEVAPGEPYTTRLLPEFALVVDPRR